MNPLNNLPHREIVGVEALPRRFEFGRVAGDENDGEALATGLAGHCGSEPRSSPAISGVRRG